VDPNAGAIPTPLQETTQADLEAKSAALPVGQVIAIVREWVALHARSLPNFAGAYMIVLANC
jgi:hypothetical protein